MSKYVIYHKFGGYVTSDNNYTDDIQKAKVFDSHKEAEIDVSSYLERIELVK